MVDKRLGGQGGRVWWWGNGRGSQGRGCSPDLCGCGSVVVVVLVLPFCVVEVFRGVMGGLDGGLDECFDGSVVHVGPCNAGERLDKLLLVGGASKWANKNELALRNSTCSFPRRKHM